MSTRESTMKNITVSIDDETYRQARIMAVEQDTSVSALVREFLERIVHRWRPTDTAAEEFMISNWDAAIVAAAKVAGAKTLYSEDLNHGQAYEGVTVHNPFL